MTTLYLLRHGETEENVKHILQGCMPGTLTEKGREQAKEAALSLKDVNFDVVLSSDLKRSVDTMEIILEELKAHGQTPSVLQTKLLRERDWGSATGMVVDGVHKIVIPKDAESVKTMKQRSRIFLDFVRKTYPNKTVLAVSHGLMCRCIQAVHRNVEIQDVEKMVNAEIRILQLD